MYAIGLFHYADMSRQIDPGLSNRFYSNRFYFIRFYSIRFYVVAIVSLTALLFSGCQLPGPSAEQQGPELLNTLPNEWTPLSFEGNGFMPQSTMWQTVNIDDDEILEYLLFFRYDNSQVGAVIYDQQVTPPGSPNPAALPAISQSTGLYVPYRIAPGYWPGAGYIGYIAPPNTAPRQIRFDELSRGPVEDATESAAAPGKELVIRVGTVMTVAWWRGVDSGYGITQVAADGGLVNYIHLNDDPTQVITTVTGLRPLGAVLARSYLCRETLYRRRELAVPYPEIDVTDTQAVQYEQEDRGLAFCASPPSYPFYPEGVVLGYLRPEDRQDPGKTEADLAAYRNAFYASNVTEEQRAAFLELIDLGPGEGIDPMIVQDIVPPVTVNVTTALLGGAAPATTAEPPEDTPPAEREPAARVCAQIATPSGEMGRRLIFELDHVPPAIGSTGAATTTTPDRLKIANIVDMTASASTCSGVIAKLTAEGRLP